MSTVGLGQGCASLIRGVQMSALNCSAYPPKECSDQDIADVTQFILDQSHCDDPDRAGVPVMWLLLGPMIVQRMTDCGMSFIQANQIKDSPKITLKDAVHQLRYCPNVCTNSAIGTRLANMRVAKVALAFGTAVASFNAIGVVSEGRSFDPTCPNGFKTVVAVLMVIKHVLPFYSEMAFKLMGTYDQGRFEQHDEGCRLPFTLTCSPFSVAQQSGRIGWCCAFKETGFMAKLNAYGQEEVDKGDKPVLLKDSPHVLGPVLVGFVLALTVQLMHSLGAFDNQSPLCSADEIKSNYLPLMWVPLVVVALPELLSTCMINAQSPALALIEKVSQRLLVKGDSDEEMDSDLEDEVIV
ncbi:MAG: hypothetical protein ACON35_04195 [Candidatus Marinamargulisbacteria bacterium]